MSHLSCAADSDVNCVVVVKRNVLRFDMLMSQVDAFAPCTAEGC